MYAVFTVYAASSYGHLRCKKGGRAAIPFV